MLGMRLLNSFPGSGQLSEIFLYMLNTQAVHNSLTLSLTDPYLNFQVAMPPSDRQALVAGTF